MSGGWPQPRARASPPARTPEEWQPGGTRNECVCPSPLDQTPGGCPWCLHRAALIADFSDAHPTTLTPTRPN